MKSYTVIFSSSCGENIEDGELLSLLLTTRDAYCAQRNDNATSSSYYSIILPCCLQVQDNECSSWKELTETINYRTHHEHCLKLSKNPNIDGIVEQLGVLSDLLPHSGCYVDVLWIENGQWPSFECNLALYGALKHLNEWHQARVSLIRVEQPIAEVRWEPWVQECCAETRALRQKYPKQQRILWKGGVTMKSVQSLKPLSLAGFYLKVHPERTAGIKRTNDNEEMDLQCFDGRIMSGHMEFMVPLDLQEIPTFYLGGPAMELCVSESPSLVLNKSRQFLGLLQENTKLCYLVRLHYGSCVTSKRQLSWMDEVLDNINNVYASPCELGGTTGFQQLVICASGDEFLAYPVRKASDLSAAVPHEIALKEMQGLYNQAVIGDVRCNHLSAQTLLQIQKNTEALQAAVLEQWIAQKDSSEMSEDTLATLLTETRNHYLDSVLKDVGPEEDLEQQQMTLCPPKPEYQGHFDHLERLILECRHNSANGANTVKSNDNLGGLSPPTKSKVLTLNAEMFTKFFKPNGEARKEPKSVLSIKKTPLCKYDCEEAKTAPWSDIVPTNYHDIYYHRGEISEILEEKSDRMKSNLMPMESSSTCNIEQTNPTAAIMILQSSPPPKHHLRKPSVTKKLNMKTDSVHHTSSKKSPRQNLKEAAGPIRTGTKRKASPAAARAQHETRDIAQGKRLYASKKQRLEVAASASTASTSKEDKQKRSMRHKKKLEEVVTNTLAAHGIGKADPLFKPCLRKLYTITFTFVKDMRGYTSLREEMEKIAKTNVEMVVMFERSQQK